MPLAELRQKRESNSEAYASESDSLPPKQQTPFLKSLVVRPNWDSSIQKQSKRIN